MSRKKKEVDVKQDKTIKDLRDVVDFTNKTNKEQDKAIKNIEESVNMSFKKVLMSKKKNMLVCYYVF